MHTPSPESLLDSMTRVSGARELGHRQQQAAQMVPSWQSAFSGGLNGHFLVAWLLAPATHHQSVSFMPEANRVAHQMGCEITNVGEFKTSQTCSTHSLKPMSKIALPASVLVMSAPVHVQPLVDNNPFDTVSSATFELITKHAQLKSEIKLYILKRLNERIACRSLFGDTNK